MITLNISEENIKKLEKLGIISIEVISENVNFDEGLSVIKILVQKCDSSDICDIVFKYRTCAVINEDYDLVGLGNPLLSLEPEINNIKQFGSDFVVDIKKSKGSPSVLTHSYLKITKNSYGYSEDVYENKGWGLIESGVKGIAISANGALYSFEKRKLVSREYSSIEHFSGDLFYVVDRIKSTIKDGYIDYFIFIIDKNGKRISNIYSRLERSLYKVEECADLDYESILEMRTNELDEHTINEKRILNELKKKYL